MARSYGVLKVSMWEPGSEFRTLSPMAQWTYTMLLSQPQISNLGLLAYTPEKWVRLAAGLNADGLDAAIGELEATRYVIVDRDTGELLVRTFIKHDSVFTQPTLVKNARVLIRSVESDTIRNYLTQRHPWLAEEEWFADAPEFDPDPRKGQRWQWDKAKIQAHEDAPGSLPETPLGREPRPLPRPLSAVKSKNGRAPQGKGLVAGPGDGDSSRSTTENPSNFLETAAAEHAQPDELEAPRLSEIEAVVVALADHDEQTLRQVEPLALAVPRSVFLDVAMRHERRVATGDVRNRTGLFMDLLRKAVKNYITAVERSNRGVELSPLEDVLADCRSYAATSMPWDAAEFLIVRKLSRWGLPDDECARIISEARSAYLSVAA